MIRTRKLKIIVIVLIVLSVSILPMAFSVSYAKWTGGSGSINGSVTVGGGGGVGGDAPTAFPGSNEKGGILVRNPETGETAVLQDDNFSLGLGSQGNIEFDGADKSKPIEIAVYACLPVYDSDGNMIFDENNNIKTELCAVNYDLTDDAVNAGIRHESGSYWYTLPCSGYYVIAVDFINELVAIYL